MLTHSTLLQDRYLVHEKIGQGSMGAIYRAVDLRLDNEVALKQIMRPGRPFRDAFVREARLLARLRHPALPKVIDYFVDDNGQFLVMEFIPGDDLGTAALKRLAPFPLEQIMDWASQLLRVLTYLHGQQPPIIHRDVKPSNLKLMANGEIILLDFGLARKEQPAPGATDDLTGYTSHYAAPEQILGQKVDARADLYALAATLYDLATGVKPPDAVRHRQAALAAGKPDPLLPAHESQPTLPTAVSTILQQALALNPEERFASAQDMLIAWQSAVAVHMALPHNLPAQYTSLVGRKAEMRAIRQRLSRDGVRLLTLTGPAGIGKTRLAQQCAAALLDDFRDGVFFVSLGPLRDATLVIASIAQALGVKESGQKSLMEHVQAWLRDRQVLLLLDNFEHVLDAARLVTDLLAACRQLSVLATSRETLHLRGEHEFPVSPLALPGRGQVLPVSEALRFTAVSLFYQRARAANPDFELNDENVTAVVDICTRLDGLPLAIELAAAHVKTLAPVQILERLADRFELLRGGPRDLPSRQQALQAALDWSHDLLPPEEKKLFRRLAVFAGGFTLETAVAICQPAANDLEPLALEVADGLASLADKNLVQRQTILPGESRYTMLVTVQAYAAERLGESGETAVLQRRHAAHYLAWAEKIRPELLGAAPESPLSQLELEHDNLRAVLQWALTSSNEEVGFHLGDALWRFWQAHGHYTEGRQWLDKLLAQNDTASIGRVKALSAAGNLAFDQGDYDRFLALHEESLVLSRRLGDKYWESIGLNNLAVGWLSFGNYEQAMWYLKESLALSREVGHTANVGHALNNLGLVALRQGNYQQARRYLEESLSTFRKQANKRATCLPLGNLGEITAYQGEYKQAVGLLQEALRLSEEIGDKWLMAQNLRSLGWIARDRGYRQQAVAQFERALKLFAEIEYLEGRVSLLDLLAKVALDSGDDKRAIALSEDGLVLCRQINDKNGTAVSLQTLAAISLHQKDYASAAARYRQALALFNELKHRLDVAACLEGLAGVASGQSQPEQAAHLLGAAAALRTTMGAPLPPVDRPQHDRLLTAVRAALNEDDFATAWADGQAMELETAVHFALQA